MPYDYKKNTSGKKPETPDRESKGKKRKKKKVNMMARGDLMGRSSGDRGYL